MADKKLVDSITISVSAILLLLGMEKYFKEYLFDYAIWMIAAGVVILVLGKKILADLNTNFAKKLLTNSVGLMLLITGMDYFLEMHMERYGLLYIILALVLYQYYGHVSAMLGSRP